MAFVPHALGDVGSNDSFGGDQSGLPDLRHIDLAKDGTGATTTNTTYVARNSNISQLDIFDNTEVVASWNTFNISSGKELQIVNNNDFVLVNQVYGGASTIAGEISTSSGGTLVIVNTAGVSISDGAVIDAANLMISTSAMSNSTWAEGQTLVSSGSGATPFGITFDAFADDGAAGSGDVTVSQNLTVTGDLVIRADDDVVINDGSSTGNVQATNIYISTDRGTVTANNRSTLNGTSSLTIDTAPGSTGGAIDVKVGATELQGIDAGAAAVTLTAGGAITQASSAKTKGGTIVIKSDNMVGSSGNPIRVDGTTLSVYGITHGSQTETNIATDNDIYIRATDSALQLGVLNSDAGNVYISGDQNVSDGDSDATTLDVVGSSLVVSTTGDVSQLGTAVSSLQTIGSGSVTVVNKADTANGDVSQTGAINLVAGSSTAASEAVSITSSTADANITIDGAFDSAKSSGFSDLTIVTANTGGVISKGGSVKVKDLTIVADEADVINSANQIAATGTIVIRGAQASTAINLGTGTGGLDLRAGELAAFADGATEMIIGASDTSGSNATTGALTVSGENVTVQNPLDIYAGATTLTNSITVGNSSSFTGTFTGSVTSANDSTADIVASTITVDTTGNFGASATDSIDVTATGAVSVSAGNASADAADTIVMTSQGDLVLGALTVRGSSVNAGDTVSLTSTGDVTDGNAGTANITAGVVTIDVTAGEGVGTSSDYLEIASVKDVSSLSFKVGGSASDGSNEFAGLHIESNAAYTVQENLFSSAGVTLRSAGALSTNSKTIDGNAAAVSLVGSDLVLTGSDAITTSGAVNLTDTAGTFAVANTAAITDFIADAVSALTITSTGGDVDLGSGSALNVSAVTESGFTVTSSANIDVSSAVTAAAAITLTANSGTGKIYGDSGITTTGALTLDAGQIDSNGAGADHFVVSSGTLLVDTGSATGNENQKITSAGAIDLRQLTTTGSGTVSIRTTNNSSTADHITIGAALDSNATGLLTLTSNDDVIISGNLDHAGAMTVIAHGAEDGAGTTGAGLLYSSGAFTATSGGVLTLRGDVIGRTNNASDALAVSSASLNLNAGASGNGAVNVTSGAAIRLDTLDTTGSGAVAITTTSGDLVVGDGANNAISNAGTGALTLTSAANVNVNEAYTHAGDVTVVANSGAGKIYGDSILTATSSALTLQGDLIGNDASATGALGVSSTSLNINAGNAGNGLVKVTSGAAIRLDTLDTTGSGAVAITTTSGDLVVGDGANNAISNAGTGALTLTSAANVNVNEAYTHAGDVTVVANSGAGKIYGDSILTATSSALTLQGDLIGNDASATGALGVSSTSLNINAGNAGNGLVKVTSGAAIRLDSLATTGSGAVAITTTSGDLVVGDGANNAISNNGTGALTLTSAANVNVNEAYTHAGDVTVVANSGAGKIYGDSILTATSSALTLQGDLIGNDASATGALGVSSTSLNINAGNAGNGLVKVTSGAAIRLDSLATTGSGAVAITTTSGDLVVGDGANNAISNNGTGALTLTSAANVNVNEAYTHAGDVTVVANSGAGKIYGDSILTATSSALTLQGDLIGNDASATGALGVSSTSLNINAGNAGNGLVKVTSGAAIRLDTLSYHRFRSGRDYDDERRSRGW
jgi:filamentous hemagglutinin family protein